jgi:hypothetical protein
MSLAYGLKSPRDILAKAERDLRRLEAAHDAEDEEGTSDALFDFAVSITSLKDWLKEHPTKAYSTADVEMYVGGSVALDAFRDIANTAKHRQIRMYIPETIEAQASATAHVSFAVLFPDEKPPSAPRPARHLKIIRGDGSRYRALDLAANAVREWREFMNSHGVDA